MDGQLTFWQAQSTVNGTPYYVEYEVQTDGTRTWYTGKCRKVYKTRPEHSYPRPNHA
jgi:hypothetical protein